MQEVYLEKVDCPYIEAILGGAAVLLILMLMLCFVLLARALEKREDHE